jgi:DNA uptake protein ComE-like DNA-binding protein
MISKLQSVIRNYFGFSRIETNGTIILTFLMLNFLFLPGIYNHLMPSQTFDDISDQAQLDSLVRQFEKLEFISENKENTERTQFRRPEQKVQRRSSKPQNKIEPFDINTADTLQLKKIFGIGSVLSVRILKYRDLLGGFVDFDQFAEVYGLKPEVTERLQTACFIKENFIPKQLSLNSAKAYELYRHPYISKDFAAKIIAYRQTNGKINTKEQLYQLDSGQIQTLKKLTSYLDFNL